MRRDPMRLYACLLSCMLMQSSGGRWNNIFELSGSSTTARHGAAAPGSRRQAAVASTLPISRPLQLERSIGATCAFLSAPSDAWQPPAGRKVPALRGRMKAAAACWQPLSSPLTCSSSASGRAAGSAPGAAARLARWRAPSLALEARGMSTHRASAAQETAAAQEPAAAAPSKAAAEADLSSALSLANIRQTLIRLEDTIIYSLIERAQFARNEAVYAADANGPIPVPGFRTDGRRLSLLEYLLRETEQVRWRGDEGGVDDYPRAACGGRGERGCSSSGGSSGAAARGSSTQTNCGLLNPPASPPSPPTIRPAGARPHPALHLPGRVRFLPRGAAAAGAAAHLIRAGGWVGGRVGGCSGRWAGAGWVLAGDDAQLTQWWGIMTQARWASRRMRCDAGG